MTIKDLIDAEALASESNSHNEELPADTRITRGNGRARTLQVRLNDDELRELQKLAQEREIPVSTLARDLIMNQVRSQKSSPQAVLARLRSDVDAIASYVA